MAARRTSLPLSYDINNSKADLVSSQNICIPGKILAQFRSHALSMSQSLCSRDRLFYPEKTVIEKDTRTPVFIAALFTIARSWKQPKCPSTDEWIKKMWYIYTMVYYSAIKRNEIGSFVEMWMNLETVIQSEVSQKEKNKYRILTHICGT